MTHRPKQGKLEPKKYSEEAVISQLLRLILHPNKKKKKTNPTNNKKTLFLRKKH